MTLTVLLRELPAITVSLHLADHPVRRARARRAGARRGDHRRSPSPARCWSSPGSPSRSSRSAAGCAPDTMRACPSSSSSAPATSAARSSSTTSPPAGSGAAVAARRHAGGHRAPAAAAAGRRVRPASCARRWSRRAPSFGGLDLIVNAVSAPPGRRARPVRRRHARRGDGRGLPRLDRRRRRAGVRVPQRGRAGVGAGGTLIQVTGGSRPARDAPAAGCGRAGAAATRALTHAAAQELRERGHPRRAADRRRDDRVAQDRRVHRRTRRAERDRRPGARSPAPSSTSPRRAPRAYTHELVVTPPATGGCHEPLTRHRPAGRLARRRVQLQPATHAPKHRIFFADFAPRLRAVLGGAPLFDTDAGEAALRDRDPARALRPAGGLRRRAARRAPTTRRTARSRATRPTGLRSATRENVVWAYEDPKPEAAWLKGYAAVYWDRMDGWFVEEEPVFGHLRDPYHRVDVHESSRPVTVRAGGARDRALGAPEAAVRDRPGDARLRPARRRRRGRADARREAHRVPVQGRGDATGRCPGSRTPPGATRRRCPRRSKIPGHVALRRRGRRGRARGAERGVRYQLSATGTR